MEIDVTFEVGETDMYMYIIAHVDVLRPQRPTLTAGEKPVRTFEATFGYIYIYEHMIKFPYNVGKKERHAL